MQVVQTYKTWPFYLCALITGAVGVAMVVGGAGLITTNNEFIDRLRGRIVHLDWEQKSSEYLLTVRIRPQELGQPLHLNGIEPSQGKEMDKLLDRQVELWIVPEDSNSQSMIVRRLANGTPFKEHLMIAREHHNDENIQASLLRWGAVLVVTAALLVVAARLVEIWHRYRHEIMGS